MTPIKQVITADHTNGTTPTQCSPAISIIIPAYNEQRLLKSCIEALLPQLQGNYEIIAVNNNSTDNTVAIARSMGTRVRVVDEPRQGISYARSHGFDSARNDILARIDAER